MYIERNSISLVPTLAVKCWKTKYCQFVGHKMHNVQAFAKGKVPERNVERGLPVCSPLYIRAHVFVTI